MTQANEFLSTQLVNGTSNQIAEAKSYLDDVLLAPGYCGEIEKNGNEVMLFCDGSVIVRIDDEATDYNDLSNYR